MNKPTTPADNLTATMPVGSGDWLGGLREMLTKLESEMASDKLELRQRKKALKINLRLKDALEYHMGIKPDYEI
jgi:hypothetical protein